MKNRIWKKILAVGVSLLAEAGMLVGCTAQPAVAYGAEMEGGLSVAQDAAWTDLQKFQAVISVKADGRHVNVADSHEDFSIWLQNFSGFPKTSDFAARFFHNFHPALCPALLLSMVTSGTVVLSP